jgi:site-specific DNA-methyltransferase (adenine-specific)
MKNLINRIIQGDCLEVLRQMPDNSVDAFITDPPYSSGGISHAERSKDPVEKYQQSTNKVIHRPSFYGDNRDCRSWLHWCTMWISECHRILKPGGYFLMFSDWRQVPTASDAIQFGNIIWRGTVAWDKTEGSRAPHKGYFRHQVEYILWGTKGSCPKAIHGGPWPGCFRVSVKQKDKFHLTGKPTELMEQLVRIVPEGSIIADPFAGSGTTLVAAKKLKRNYIGIEKEKLNVEVAQQRLSFSA